MKPKPVFVVDGRRVIDLCAKIWEYEYNAYAIHGMSNFILASDSLANLKAEIKARNWSVGFIQCESGGLSYGQRIPDAYPYCPQYGRAPSIGRRIKEVDYSIIEQERINARYAREYAKKRE